MRYAESIENLKEEVARLRTELRARDEAEEAVRFREEEWKRLERSKKEKMRRKLEKAEVELCKLRSDYIEVSIALSWRLRDLKAVETELSQCKEECNKLRSECNSWENAAAKSHLELKSDIAQLPPIIEQSDPGLLEGSDDPMKLREECCLLRIEC